MATAVVLTGDYTLGQGQVLGISGPWVAGQGRGGLVITGLSHALVEVDGTLNVSDNTPDEQYDPFGIASYSTSFDATSLVHIGATGTINVSTAPSSISSLHGVEGLLPVRNDGAITVTGVHYADEFISNSYYFPQFAPVAGGVVNTGSITVSAQFGAGVRLAGTVLNNSGTITGHVGAEGVIADYAPVATTVLNSGQIRATPTGTAYEALGIFAPSGGELTVVNSGAITGDNAIYADEASYANPSLDHGSILHLTNTGTIIGGIVVRNDLSPAVAGLAGSVIHNSGTITGYITLYDYGGDLYDGRGGTLSGGLRFGGGVAYLGSEGETVYSGVGVSLIYGGSGADTVHGGSGADFVDGGGGNDVLDGGGGLNTLSYASATTGVTVNLSVTSAQNTGVGLATISNFQSLTGSAFSDHLIGDAGSNIIDAGAGGNDVMDGAGGTNTASFAHETTGVTVSLAAQGAAQNTGAGSVTLTNFAGLIGSAYSDHLTGDANDNLIDGGAGGNDVLDGAGGTNTVSFSYASAGVNVSLALQGSAQNTGVGSETLTNFENLGGSIHNDRLAGDANNNFLTGGLGKDIFVGSAGHDTITDFSQAQGDKLDLSYFHLHSFADALGHAVQSGGNTVFTVGADQLTLQNVTRSSLTALDLGLPSISHDLTGSGYSDILFRDPSGQWGFAAFGSTGAWTWKPMGGSTASYGLAGSADFNGDGVSDIVFREASTGNWGYAQMNSSGSYIWQYMGASTASYHEVTTGDFNGDGTADIAFREASTGNWGFAEMHGASYVWHAMGGSTASYSMVGANDFNGDGTSDILFRENATGNWGVAFMNSQGGYSWALEGGSTASYSVAGTGDFNGDGTSDILFREDATGNWGYAEMHGTSWIWHPMGASTASYSVIGTGDYNGDGIADVAFREASTGLWGYAEMHGAADIWHPMGGSTASYGAF